MKVEIIDFNKKYANEIYDLQTSQWGFWDDESVIEKPKDNEINLIALKDKKFAGFFSGELENDSFHLKVCCVKPEFQKVGIGTLLLKEIIQRAKEMFKFSKFIAESISVYGKCNSKKMLENAGFKLVRIDKHFWGKLYPRVFCKECLKQPCECDALVYELENDENKKNTL